MFENFDETNTHSAEDFIFPPRKFSTQQQQPLFIVKKRLFPEPLFPQLAQLFLLAEDTSPGTEKLKFDSKSDFDVNFGKENWFSQYQASEISRNNFPPEPTTFYKFEDEYLPFEAEPSWNAAGKCYPSVSNAMLESCWSDQHLSEDY